MPTCSNGVWKFRNSDPGIEAYLMALSGTLKPAEFRGQNWEFGKVATQVTSITGRQAAGLMEGMRRYQKIRNQMPARTALAPIFPEDLTCGEGAFRSERIELDTKGFQCGKPVSNRRKEGGNLGEYDVAHGQARFPPDGHQQIDPGPCVILAPENAPKDRGINCRAHFSPWAI